MSNQTREISIVLDSSPITNPIKDGTLSAPDLKLNFTEYAKINKAFAPMVRNLAFDVCEMAVITFLQALDAGKPLRLLPVVLVGRLHHRSLFYDPSNGPLTPAELRGKRVGVRAYTQTTGMWVRSILQEQYGVPLDEITFVTTEDAHVAGYVNPANVEKIEGANLTEMMQKGEVSAIIMGPKQAEGLSFQQLIPDVEAAGAEWYNKHRTVPINHMVTVTEELLKKDPEAVMQVYELLRQGIETTASQRANGPLSAVSAGLDKIWEGGALQLAMQYAVDQKLISRVFTKEEIFADIFLK